MAPAFRAIKSRFGGERVEERPVETVNPAAISRLFAPPNWLENLGRSSWLLVGSIIVVLALIWVLGETASIVMPVVTAAIVAAVAGPVTGWLSGHGVPRGAAAALLIAGALVAIVGLFVAIVGAIVDQTTELQAQLEHASDRFASAMRDLGIDRQTVADTQQAANETAASGVSTLVNGLAAGVKGLSSVAMFVAFMLLSLFFLLKDGPAIRVWVERQAGIPPEMARGVTSRIVQSLRGYFVGVTAIAVFNATVVSLGALAIGVPNIPAIALVTFIGAYVPFVGAWVAGAFAVLIALGSAGANEAVAMTVIVLLANGILQQLVQPLAYGAALGIHPLAVLIVTIAAGALFGMIGLVLAAPLTSAVVRIVADVAAAREAAGLAGAGDTNLEPATG